jgi:hypothetical protein
MSLHEHQADEEQTKKLDPENWSNISFKQIIEELVEIKKRLNELETCVLHPKTV